MTWLREMFTLWREYRQAVKAEKAALKAHFAYLRERQKEYEERMDRFIRDNPS